MASYSEGATLWYCGIVFSRYLVVLQSGEDGARSAHESHKSERQRVDYRWPVGFATDIEDKERSSDHSLSHCAMGIADTTRLQGARKGKHLSRTALR